MKHIVLLLCISLVCVGIGRAGYVAATPQQDALSKRIPAGAVLYLEARDLSILLNDWNSSPQKKAWVQSDNYEIFSRSRLFLRLKAAADQFATAAGLPPNMDFLSQVAGQQSALALYDIGKLQFLYITNLPSARSMQTTLWQMRAKFEPRNVAGTDFFVRRDPESQREVAFAVSGDYLLLSTREDLIASALQLIAGKGDRTVENEPWWMQSTSAAGQAGDLRMVLDMKTLVSNGYFRTYWVQQNITDLSQYSSAVSDLFREGKRYREERVLIRKKESDLNPSPDGSTAVADLARLVPEDASVYTTTANPSAESCFALLETKLLAPHLGPVPVSKIAPQVQLTAGEQGDASDLETQIDRTPSATPTSAMAGSELRAVLHKTPVLASLTVQSSQQDHAGVFVRSRSAVVLETPSEWNESDVGAAITDFVSPDMTTSRLGTLWQQKSGYRQLDGLWPLAFSVQGKYLLVSDDSSLMESVLGNFSRKPDREPAEMLEGFNHAYERPNFVLLTNSIDRPGASAGNGTGRQPQFFSGNMASLSNTLAALSSERIEIRNDSDKVRQTVVYEWSQ